MIMKKPTLTEIKKSVVANGGTYEKCDFKLNYNDAYKVNGSIITKSEMTERYLRGEL